MIKVLFASAVNPLLEIENRLRPLWPAYLAAYAEQHLGSGHVLFKFMTGKMEEELAAFRPDIVAISSVTQNFNYAIQYARIAKLQNCAVIVGGMHITSVPHSLTSDMDIGCIGEGEETFLELLKLYEKNGAFLSESLQAVKGIVFHDGAHLVKTEDRMVFESLDTLPHPARSLIGYSKRGYLYTARGCPYKCVFCACTRYWGQVRYSSPEYVVQEIKELVDHGVNIIRFNDENFVANKERVQRISELIVENGFHRKVKFSCWCRSNNVTSEVVKALKAMNIVSVKMGLESGCDRTLQYLKGGVTVQDNWNAINLLKKVGIQANGDFIIGAPYETREEIMMTYDFIRRSGVDFVDVNVLSPLPGTVLWEYAIKRKLVSDDMNWDRLNFKFKENDPSSLILSETVSYEEMRILYKKFKQLRIRKIIKALPKTPWLRELPGVIWKRIRENSINFIKHRYPAPALFKKL
jgi:radical SAM superfamily enzyme YgiQ (UPF0313 family)